jgi:signal transduction histidine kinase
LAAGTPVGGGRFSFRGGRRIGRAASADHPFDYAILKSDCVDPGALRVARKSAASSACFLMLPENGTSAVVRGALEAVANDLGASTFEAPPKELLTLFARRFADTGRANLLVVDVSDRSAELVEAAQVAQAFGTSPLILVDRSTGSPVPLSPQLPLVEYERSQQGLRRLQAAFRTLLRQRRPPPRRWQPSQHSAGQRDRYQLDQLSGHRLELLTLDLLRSLGYRRIRHSSILPMIELLAEPPYLHAQASAGESLCLIASPASTRPGVLRRVLQRDFPALSAALRRIRHAPRPSPELFPFPTRLAVILFLPSLSSVDEPSQSDVAAELRLDVEELSDLLSTPVDLEIYDRRRILALLQSNPQIAARYFDITTGAAIRSNEEYFQEHRGQGRDDRPPDPQLTTVLEQLDHERKLRVEAEREAAWKDVAFTAAHKLGNPIFAIETNLQELRDVTSSSDLDILDIVADISTSVEKAKVIIEHFKSLTKFRNISPRPVDIVPLLRSAFGPARAMGIKTRVASPPGGVVVLADPSLITHCFDELVGNAVHYLDKSSKRLTATLSAPAFVPEELLPQLQSGAYARVRIADNGRGVPRSLKDSIFTPFFSTRTNGSGFGLSMIRSVVEGHGGAIREVGREKRGATFELFLPLAEPGDSGGDEVGDNPAGG